MSKQFLQSWLAQRNSMITWHLSPVWDLNWETKKTMITGASSLVVPHHLRGKQGLFTWGQKGSQSKTRQAPMYKRFSDLSCFLMPHWLKQIACLYIVSEVKKQNLHLLIDICNARCDSCVYNIPQHHFIQFPKRDS